jgi:phosphodiesterase/alkaline phosphatase D-like protein
VNAGTINAGNGEITVTFATPPPPPSVTTGAGSNVADTSADLAGSVNPNASATNYTFEYGPSLSFGSITPVLGAGSGTGATAESASLAALTPSTTYYYRLVATSAAGTTFGAVASLTTTGPPAPPVAVTGTASGVGAASATLAGQVDPEGQATAFTIEYGTTTAFGAITPVVELDSASTLEAVSATASGLAPGTTYFYRVVAANPTGGSVGAVMSFTTGQGGAPVATTGNASGVTATAATLSGVVNPRGSETTFAFEYGTSTSFGSLSQVDDAGATGAPDPVSLPLSGLAPNTTYLYRIVATNAGGTTAGAVASFTTAP